MEDFTYNEMPIAQKSDILAEFAGRHTKTWKCALVATREQKISIVEVPLRIGAKRASSPMDLDVFLWVPLALQDVGQVFDLNSNQLVVDYFPFDGPNRLKYAYTFYFTDQEPSRSLKLNQNKIAMRITGHKAEAWYGDILVIKTRRLEEGILNVHEQDLPDIERILKEVLLDGRLAAQL